MSAVPAPLADIDPKALREARERAELSQAKLAAAAEISPGYVAMIELGQRRASLGVAAVLARVLGVELDALLRPQAEPETADCT